MTYFFQQFARFLQHFPKSVLLSLLILAALSILPASQIQSDFNLEAFFPADDATIIEYRNIADLFGREDNVIALAFENKDLLTSQGLKQLDDFVQQLETLPHLKQIISLFNASSIFSDEGTLRVSSYFDEAERHLLNTETKEQLLSDFFVKNLLVNESGTITAIYIRLLEERNSYPFRKEVISQLLSMISAFEQAHNLDVKISGIPYFRNMYVDKLNIEIGIYIALGSALIVILLWVLFRNVRDVIIPLLIVWITLLFTVAAIAMSGGFFEIMSSTISPILLCVGIADSVHMLAKYNDVVLNTSSKTLAVNEAVISMGNATLLTSITTAIGFGTLLVSNVLPMKRFGLYTAIGVLVAYVVTMFFLPSVLHILKSNQQKEQKKDRIHQWIGRFLRNLYYWSKRYYHPIVIGGFLVALVMGYGALRLKVNSYVFDDVSRKSVLMKDAAFMGERLTPLFPLEFILNTNEPEGAFDEDRLEQIKQLDAFLHSYPEIKRITGLHTILGEVHRVMTGEATDAKLSRAQIAQYILLLEMADDAFLTRYLDFDYQTIRITAQMDDIGSFRVNQLRAEISAYLNQHHPDWNVTLTGNNILVADLTVNIVNSLLSSVVLAVFFIAIILVLLFRNAQFFMIALLPNLLPLLITAGFMGFYGIDIKPSTAVIFTIAFGIAVDDSIHFLARLKLELQKGFSLDKALRITTEKTGRAIILTSLLLLSGFGVLGTSQFDSTLFMGMLTCLTIITALVYDLLFLPALIYWIKPDVTLNVLSPVSEDVTPLDAKLTATSRRELELH